MDARETCAKLCSVIWLCLLWTWHQLLAAVAPDRWTCSWTLGLALHSSVIKHFHTLFAGPDIHRSVLSKCEVRFCVRRGHFETVRFGEGTLWGFELVWDQLMKVLSCYLFPLLLSRHWHSLLHTVKTFISHNAHCVICAYAPPKAAVHPRWCAHTPSWESWWKNEQMS